MKMFIGKPTQTQRTINNNNHHFYFLSFTGQQQCQGTWKKIKIHYILLSNKKGYLNTFAKFHKYDKFSGDFGNYS